jgi:hypothetical protein
VGSGQTLTVGAFLPYLELAAAPGGRSVALRPRGRQATVAVRVHSAACPECRRYLSAVAGAASDLAAWDGRVVVLLPGALGDAETMRRELALPFPVASEALDQAPLIDGAGVVIADRYGQIYHVADAGTGHEVLLPPRELEEWLKFLATQCPE